jgi:hypothetical protein
MFIGMTIALTLNILAPVPAAPGAAAGSYYYTDIVTYLWDTPVNSINIGGVTLIDAESMARYGFTVTWLAKERRLEIVDKLTSMITLEAEDGALLSVKRGSPGSVAGRYYSSDIKTTLNGKEIVSYNTGGETFIGAEAMKEFGYHVSWDDNARKLFIQRESTAVSFAINSIDYCGDELYWISGGGTADKDYAVTIKVPSGWTYYAKNWQLDGPSYHSEPHISAIRLYGFSSERGLPDAMYPYNNRYNVYDENMAKDLIAVEKLTLSGRETLAEHRELQIVYGYDAIIYHDYYIRADNEHVTLVRIMSTSMDGEAERRKVVDSMTFSYQERRTDW